MILLGILIILVILFLLVIKSKKHKIIVSMTTIPERIEDGRIYKTIRSILDQSYPVDAFYINIPHKTRKNKSYPEDKIEEIRMVYPFVTINRVETDLGPITKLIPTIHHLEPYDYLVLIDDDVIYGKHMIMNLMNSKLDAAGYAGRRGDLEFFTSGDVSGNTPCTFLETYAGVLYRSDIFDTFNQYYKEIDICKNQDDIVIGHYLHTKNIPRHIISSEFQCSHDGTGSPELRNENLIGGNRKCYETLFK